jgi:6-hydroxycyclohex-1-ene-1-carbonyl-CoA dehydrogenase
MTLPDCAVIADAVTTALQAVRRSQVKEGDLAIVVGAGGVGTFAVQCAAAKGARVIALDVDDARLEAVSRHGATRTINVRGMSTKAVRDAVRATATALDFPQWAWKIFECSGTPTGQDTAWSLLVPAGMLAIVGFTREPVTIRLSNLMAYDADAFGTWGCPVEVYPEAIRMAVEGDIVLQPFVRHVSLGDVERVLQDVRVGAVPKRTVLIP